jgi:AcrR family transcriptional regulator
VLKIVETGIKNPLRVQARRGALVRAAVDVFAERGYHSSRVADVALAAGVSQGTVYNYVTSKEDLLYLICEDHILAYERIVTAALHGKTDPLERLDCLLRATIESVFSHRKHYLVMLRDLHNVERTRRRDFKRLAARQRQLCQDVLTDIAARRPLIISDPLMAANIVVYLPKLIISRGWDLKGRVSDDRVAEELLAFMRRGLGLGSQAGAATGRG